MHRFEPHAGYVAVLEQEVGNAGAINDLRPSTLDAHAGAAQRLTHFGESAGAVFRGDGQTFHSVLLVVDAGS